MAIIKQLEPMTEGVKDNFYHKDNDEVWRPLVEKNYSKTSSLEVKNLVILEEGEDLDDHLLAGDSVYTGVLPVIKGSSVAYTQQGIIKINGHIYSPSNSRNTGYYNQVLDSNNSYLPMPPSGTFVYSFLSGPSPDSIATGTRLEKLREYQRRQQTNKPGILTNPLPVEISQYGENYPKDAFGFKIEVKEDIHRDITAMMNFIPLSQNSSVNIYHDGHVRITGDVGMFDIETKKLVTDDDGYPKRIVNCDHVHPAYLTFRSNSEKFSKKARQLDAVVDAVFLDSIRQVQDGNQSIAEFMHKYFSIDGTYDASPSSKINSRNYNRYKVTYRYSDSLAMFFEPSLKIDNLNLTPITKDSCVEIDLARQSIRIVGTVIDVVWRVLKPGTYPFYLFNVKQNYFHHESCFDNPVKYCHIPLHEFNTDKSLPLFNYYAFGLTPLEKNGNVLKIRPYDCDREQWDNHRISMDPPFRFNVDQGNMYYYTHTSYGFGNSSLAKSKTLYDDRIASTHFNLEQDLVYSRRVPRILKTTKQRCPIIGLNDSFMIDWRKWVVKMEKVDEIIREIPSYWSVTECPTALPFACIRIHDEYTHPHAQGNTERSFVIDEDTLPLYSYSSKYIFNDNFNHGRPQLQMKQMLVPMTDTNFYNNLTPQQRFSHWYKTLPDAGLPHKQVNGYYQVWVGPGDFPLYSKEERNQGKNILTTRNGKNEFKNWDWSQTEVILENFTLDEAGYIENELFRVEKENGWKWTRSINENSSMTECGWIIRSKGYIKDEEAMSPHPFFPLGSYGHHLMSYVTHATVSRDDLRKGGTINITGVLGMRLDRSTYLSCQMSYNTLFRQKLSFTIPKNKSAYYDEQFHREMVNIEAEIVRDANGSNCAYNLMGELNYLKKYGYGDFIPVLTKKFDNSIYCLSSAMAYINPTNFQETHIIKTTDEGANYYESNRSDRPTLVWTGDEATSYINYPSSVVGWYPYRNSLAKRTEGAQDERNFKYQNSFVATAVDRQDVKYNVVIDGYGRIVKHKATLKDIREGNPIAFLPSITMIQQPYVGIAESNRYDLTLRPFEDNKYGIMVPNFFTYISQKRTLTTSLGSQYLPSGYLHSSAKTDLLMDNNFENNHLLRDDYFDTDVDCIRTTVTEQQITPREFINENDISPSYSLRPIKLTAQENQKPLQFYQIYPFARTEEESPRLYYDPIGLMNERSLGINQFDNQVVSDIFYNENYALESKGPWMFNARLAIIPQSIMKVFDKIHGPHYVIEENEVIASNLSYPLTFNKDWYKNKHDPIVNVVSNHPYSRYDFNYLFNDVYPQIFHDYKKVRRLVLFAGRHHDDNY